MTPLPISHQQLHRFMIGLIVILAILAGYYRSSLTANLKKYQLLEDKYVRVRDQLGIKETQRLIEQSYQ